MMLDFRRKTLGIIGGMGPLATSDLFSKIIEHTRARSDQEHIHIIIDNNTDIPDRTGAILAGGKDPLPELIASAYRLCSAGADFLIMPCNTAHYYYPQLCNAVDVPVLNMLEETAKTLSEKKIRTAGLLATDGTVQSGVYHQMLTKYGIQVLTPDEHGQREVMHMIYDVVKAGCYDTDISGFLEVCSGLLSSGAEILVLGCTELPPAFQMFSIHYPHVDPTLVLARSAIQFAGAEFIPDSSNGQIA